MKNGVNSGGKSGGKTDVSVADVARAAVALLCAVTLWFVVSAEQSAAAWVPVQVTVVLDSTTVLAEPLVPVQAFVVGRRRDMLRLYQTPPTLHRTVSRAAPAGAVHDSVRLELREQDLVLPSGTGARIGDMRPRVITVRLRRP